MSAKPLIMDNQNKPAWCKIGLRYETEFVTTFGYKTRISINPEKATNKYAPDMMHETGRFIDLKTQNTRFDTSMKYGVPANYAVTFNEKDLNRYSEKYPNIIVVFWVRWLNAVYAISLNALKSICTYKNKHEYKQRIDDESGNAKCSFVLDVRNMKLIACN